MFATVYLLALLIVNFFGEGANSHEEALHITLNVYPWMFIVVSIWVAIAYYRGGAMLLGMAHASRVTLEENRDLFRLVENTAIMAGLPTPEIYFIEDASLNAFATGRDPKTASIALTRGIVEKLEKTELQAVIAHELAHIGNRDTRLMIITVAGIGCFLFFGELLFRVALRSGRGRKSGKATVILLFVSIACLLFGYVIAPILRFALSRRREYQADATAVRITRDPDALVRALTKITLNPRVEAIGVSPLVGNMYIINPAKSGFFSRLYCTHPPIDDRLAALIKMTGVNEGPQAKAQLGKAVW